MKRFFNKYVLICNMILMFMLLVNPTKVNAVNNKSDFTRLEEDKLLVGTTQYSNNYTYSGYVIDNYNIDMVVNENNTFDIIETITAYFNVSKHGIFRKIPLKNSITRLDGSKSNNRAKISNISVNEKYTTSNEGGYKVIKIGDANKTITGSHTYTIKYTYNIGKDPIKEADELYFNLIGNQWDTSISKVSFTIKMPKSFDRSLLGFSSGNVGSTASSNVEYSVNGNTITGNTINKLYAGQALTVRLTLPEGYFIGASNNIDMFSVCVIILCEICVLIAYRLWVKYGKDEQVIETVEFYPPKGYNSAEAAFLYEGSADTKAVISLLIYLANQGYLKIEETEETGLFSKSKGFKITKLKEYTGNNEYEEMFFNGLFKGLPVENLNMQKEKEIIAKEIIIMQKAKLHREKITSRDAMETSESKNSVTASDLYDNFYITLNMIKKRINSKENKRKIFESTSRGKWKWFALMIIAIFVLITVKPIAEYGEGGLGILPFVLLFPRNRLYCINRKSHRCYKNA